jgi:23S rRNA (guanosine2251-2'-O)-methyltransferase
MKIKNKSRIIALALDNIRSVYNVGSIFRTSACFGVDEIMLCGVTPAPTDRFGRPHERLKKVALHGDEMVAWKQSESTYHAIKEYRNNGFMVLGIEQTAHSLDLKTTNFEDVRRLLLVLGEETKGLTQSIIDLCDDVIEIKTKGNKESLNVSIAA